MSITIKLNGEKRTLDSGMDILNLIEILELPKEGIAVVHNRDIIKREVFGRIRLEDGDELELIRFVGGG